MLTIIELEARPDGGHGLESQSHREENWMGEGWIAVPPQWEEKAWGCCGYCELVVEDGKLVELIPGKPPAPPPPPPTAEEILDTMLGVNGHE